MRQFFTMALSTFPYPFMIFLAAAVAGVALVVLRDCLRKTKRMPEYRPRPTIPLDEIYND